MSNQENSKKDVINGFISLGYKLEAIKDYSQENYTYLIDEIMRLFSEVPLVYSNRVQYYTNPHTKEKIPEILFLFYNKAPTNELIRFMRNVGFEYHSKTIEWKINFPLSEVARRFLIQLGNACKKYICLNCNNPFEWLPNFKAQYDNDSEFRPTKSQLTEGLKCPNCKSIALKQDFTFLKQYQEKPTQSVIPQEIKEVKQEDKPKDTSTKCQKCGGISDYNKIVKGQKIYSCIECGL